jgi:NAD(P)-dependent dehydrogenase (short-subunit alcohol dehydrogenase family)
MKELTDRVAIITGAGAGIGRATALALAEAGSRVVVTDIDAARAEEVASGIIAAGGHASGRTCDVSSDADMAALRDTTLAELGRIDIVMNNVGILHSGRPEDIPVSAWQQAVDLNIISVARSISLFLPDLLAQGSGHIVNTASVAGLWGYAYSRLPYSATKAAVIALSEGLVLYTRPRGVGVTVLCPGPVATRIVENMQVYGEPLPMQIPPGLALLDPSVVGAQVVNAIRNDIFFVPTHAEVHDVLVERATDPEGFLARQAEALGR